MHFSVYEKLCTWLVKDGSKEAIFSWAFLTLTWNLCCRSKNTILIHRNHISWEGDCLTIQFAHSKTDQQGFNEAFKRHIYANAINPHICPVLALSVYLSINPVRTQGKLFSGAAQYARFRKNLLSLVRKYDDELIRMGVDPAEIGVHSIRKGAATYVMNGTTSSPSLAGLCNRAGWTMGKVKDTYLQYEAAQDQYIGRIICGLNVNSYTFSASPPYFSSNSNEQDIQHDANGVFPFVIDVNYRLLTRFCLASLIYHKAFLMQTLGARSPFRSNTLLTNLLRSDPQNVIIKYAHEDSDVVLTGIPVHVIVLVNQERERVRLEEIYLLLSGRIDATSDRIVGSVREDLDSRGIHGGDVSVNRLQELLRPMQTQLNTLVNDQNNLRSQPSPATNPSTEPRSEHVDILMFQWGDKFRRLPEGFKFNRNMSLLQAWIQWHHGCTYLTHNIGPLKRVEQIDITDFRRDSKGQKRSALYGTQR